MKPIINSLIRFTNSDVAIPFFKREKNTSEAQLCPDQCRKKDYSDKSHGEHVIRGIPGMKTALLAIVSVLICRDAIAQSNTDEAPNVLFVIADDLGWKDVGFMGGDFFETPNIDRLSQQGMVFTNSYAGAANCAPSRACLMTGQNTPRHGVYTVGSSARGESKDRKLIPTPNTVSLQLEVVTMANMFKQAGYVTGTFGKWHLGQDPTMQGFDVNVGGDLSGNPGRDGYFSPYNVAHLEDGPEGEHLTDRLTAEAITFMNANRDKPFFLYLPYYAVHTPLLAKKELTEKYRARQNSNIKGINPVYAAMVETMDNNVGRLINELKKLNLEKNTIVVFTSDNGGAVRIATQLALRAGKGSYYEGGIRVPTIIQWPGKVKAGTVTDKPIVNLDFYPTFKEILGISLPNKVLDGQSLLPVLKGGTLRKRPLFWHFPIYLQSSPAANNDARDPQFRTRPGSVIRYGDWKLHQYFEDDGIELYNLKADLGERNNLHHSHPDKVKELLAMLEEWRKRTNAPVPMEPNPDYKQ